MVENLQENSIDTIASIVSKIGDLDDDLARELEDASELGLDKTILERLDNQREQLVKVFWRLTSLVEDLRVIAEENGQI